MKKARVRKIIVVLASFIYLAALGAIAAFPDKLFELRWRQTSPFKERMAEAFPGSSRSILENASEVTLYKITYDLDHGNITQSSQPGEFHGCKTPRQTVVKGFAKRRFLKSLYEGIAEKKAFRAACFSPVYALRAVHNGKTVDLIICFNCMIVASFTPQGRGSCAIGSEPKSYFENLLEGGAKL